MNTFDPSKVASIRDVKPKYTQIFIDNQFVDSIGRHTFPTIDPATTETIAQIQEARTEDVNAAVAAAKRAFHRKAPWRQMDASKRGELLMKWAALVERDAAMLASLETRDMGKPFKMAVFDVCGVAGRLRYSAGWADKIHGKTIPSDGPYFTFTRIEPVGVVGAIVPWNFPMQLFALKAGQALAAGCTMVIKPAEQSPLTALHLAALSKEAGFPDGVINVIPGYGPEAGAPLCKHPDVDKISFTGSTEVGRLISKCAADSNLKRITLELGGKSPLVVFDDADLDFAVESAHFALFFNTGQCCTAGSRTFVSEKIYDQFVKKAADRAQKRVVGNPFDDVESGPLVSEEQYNKVLELIESGKNEGAKLLVGGGKYEKAGYYIQPTVFADVNDNMRIAKEEIFGPVQQILKFKTMDEAIDRANDTEYGLAASIFTNDYNKALEFAAGVKAGNIWVNGHHIFSQQAPFGGYKLSGVGREGGEEGILAFCEVKHVSMKTNIKLA